MRISDRNNKNAKTQILPHGHFNVLTAKRSSIGKMCQQKV